MNHPRPPTLPPSNDALAVLQQVLGLVWRALRYWGRRTRQQPLIGLLYAAVWLPVGVLLFQNAHQAIALKLTAPYHRVEQEWPLTGTPWPPPILLGLVAALVVPVFVDGWAKRRMNQAASTAISAALDALPGVPIPPDVWAVGKVVTRTWQPDPAGWVFELTEEIFTLTGRHLRVGLLVDAPPGGGKTSLVLKPILHLCERQAWAAVVWDVKGDDVAPGERPDYDPREFRFDVTIDFTHPARSAKLNIAAGRTPREIGEAWGEALLYDPESRDQYFVENARSAVGSLVAAHHRAYGTIPSFRRLLAYLRDPAARKDLTEQLRKAGAGAKSDELLDLARIEQLLAAKDTDPLGRLDLALAPLARGEIADLLVTDNTGVRLWDLLDQGKRVRVILPVEKHQHIAPIIGRLVCAQFTAAVLDGTCGPGRLKVALIDEAHWFVTPTVAAGMAQARANGGCYVLAFQDLQQITDANLRAKIRAVSGNTILFPGLAQQDADDYSKTFPAQERRTISQSATTGSTASRTSNSGSGSHQAGSSRQHSQGSSQASSASSGESRQWRWRADWEPAELRYLATPGRFVIERRDAAGTVTPPTVIAVDHALAAALRHDQQIGAALRGPARPPGLPPIALIPAPDEGTPSCATTAPPVALPLSAAATPVAPPLANLPPPAAPPLPADAPVTVAAAPSAAPTEPEPSTAEPRLAAPEERAGAAPEAPAPPTEEPPPAAPEEPDPPRSPAPLHPRRAPAVALWQAPRHRARAAGGPAAATPQHLRALTDPAPVAARWAADPRAPRIVEPGILAAVLCTALSVDEDTAVALVQQAQDRGWTDSTVLALLTEVQADPNVTQPAAVFKRRILANKPPVV